MEKIWVVVADSVRARLFRAENATGPLHEECDILNPQARLNERELVTDAPGTAFAAGNGSERRQKYEPRSEKKHQTRLFARDIIAAIENLRGAGELDGLYVVAEPGFLGQLRGQYSSSLKKCLRDEIRHRVTTEPAGGIRALLPRRL